MTFSQHLPQISQIHAHINLCRLQALMCQVLLHHPLWTTILKYLTGTCMPQLMKSERFNSDYPLDQIPRPKVTRMLILALLLIVAKVIIVKLLSNYQKSRFLSHQKSHQATKQQIKSNRKPKWVKKETLRLCAFLPNLGCRKIANHFNRIHLSSGESISKNYVYRLRLSHQYEINSIRRLYKNRIPKEIPIHQTWGIDITGKICQNENRHIFGIIDHGSRLLLKLGHIRTKSTIQILRLILNTIETHQKPKHIRTDNEAIFCNPLFKFTLVALGIKHQRTQLNSPWQNGRIERLFWTLKSKVHAANISTLNELNQFLHNFKFWYNHARPHQHIRGLTPMEYIHLKKGSLRQPKKAELYYGYNGLLQGVLIKR